MLNWNWATCRYEWVNEDKYGLLAEKLDAEAHEAATYEPLEIEGVEFDEEI